MRILIYCVGRSGSTTLLHWISKELNLVPIMEPFREVEKGDPRCFNNNFIGELDLFQKMDGFVSKMLFESVPQTDEIKSEEDFFKSFDKVITLYRHNLKEYAISNVVSKTITRNYFADYKWDLVKDHIDMNLVHQFMGESWESLEYIKQLKNCEIFTYEEIFERQDHKRLLEYLNITNPKYIDILSPSNRYRK
jgi:hypothetical protein